MDKIRGAFFRDAQGSEWLDVGSRTIFTSSRCPPLWISVLQLSLFVHDVALRTWLVDQTLLEHDLSALLLRALAVGRQTTIRVDRVCSRHGERRFDEPF